MEGKTEGKEKGRILKLKNVFYRKYPFPLKNIDKSRDLLYNAIVFKRKDRRQTVKAGNTYLVSAQVGQIVDVWV